MGTQQGGEGAGSKEKEGLDERCPDEVFSTFFSPLFSLNF